MEKVTTNEYGYFEYNYTATSVGDNNVSVVFEGDEHYYSTEASDTFDVSKRDAYLTVDEVDDTEVGSTVTFTGKLAAINDNPISNASIIITVNGEELTCTTGNNGIFSKSYITKYGGNNIVLIRYESNESYYTSYEEKNFKVNDDRKEVYLGFYDQSNKQTLGDCLIINGESSLPGGFKILLMVDDERYEVELFENDFEVNVFEQTILLNKLGTVNVQAIFEGNTEYQAKIATMNFEVIKEKIAHVYASIESYYVDNGDNAILKGYMYDKNDKRIPNQKLHIYVDYVNVANVTTDNNGIFTYNIKATTMGTNNVTVEFKGNSYINPVNNKTTFTVSKIITRLSVDKIAEKKMDDNVVITGKLSDENNKAVVNAKVDITLNNQKFTATTDGNGVYSFTTKAKTVGTNNVTVSYAGESKYVNSNAKTTFNVNQIDTKLTINNIPDCVVDEV